MAAKIKTHCSNGHDLAVTRRQLAGKNKTKTSYCIECQKKRSTLYRKDPKNSEKVRKWASVSSRRSRYGLETDQFLYLVREQEERCAVCTEFLPTDPYNVCVDHDHATGKVRGLLCRACNLGLGHFKDDLHRMKMAVGYLEANRVL